MSPLTAALIMLLIFFALVVINLPMGAAIGLAAMVGLKMVGLPLTALGTAAFESLYSFTLIAIPFFIFAGNVLTEGGISRQLVNLAHVFVARIKGGLGMVLVVAAAFFAALSGSSTATTVAIGGMMVPEMVEKGYDKDYALAIAAAGGVVGPIIPPSVGFILYGVATNTSIGDMFLGGVFPGLIMTLFLLITVYITASRRGIGGEGEKMSLKQKLMQVWYAKWALLAPVIILGGIYSGIFTPTEAGAVVSVYAVIVAMFIENRMNIKDLWRVAVDSTKLSASVLFMVGTATAFGRVMVIAQVPQKLSEFIMGLSDSGIVIMLAINLFLLVVGCIMDATASILILSPMLLPVAEAFGYSAVEFGVILVSNLTIGAITPPVGCCLFAASVMGKRPLEKIAYQALPFLLALCAVLIVMIIFPQTISFLPNLFK